LATTYAAVNALCTLNSNKALEIIKLEPLAKWIRSLKLENGAFRMHEDGEEDLRYYF
jgi:prenyltransferase beta subunit